MIDFTQTKAQLSPKGRRKPCETDAGHTFFGAICKNTFFFVTLHSTFHHGTHKIDSRLRSSGDCTEDFADTWRKISHIFCRFTEMPTCFPHFGAALWYLRRDDRCGLDPGLGPA
ncbi:hypothetical protein [Cypionkella sp.]|uniref:hypothetical protein n=1 Tax=Cypionkella sp. TaxID=2811411 RepID=UPI003753B194